MKIGIDARFITHPQKGGFKTYSENLIAALADINSENEYVLYLDRSPIRNSKLPDRPNFLSRVIVGKFPAIGMPWREQISLSLQIKRDKLDLFHSPCQTAPLHMDCASIVTMHDMIWLFPERIYREKGQPISLQRKLMGWYYHFIPQIAARQATAIITVSNASKESIVRCLKISPDRIFVTYEAASPIYHLTKNRAELDAIRNKYQLDSNFILAIGSADPRKNMANLIHAYATLPPVYRQKYILAIVWTHPYLATVIASQIKNSELESRVRFLTDVSNQDLNLLYNAATIFAFPSLYEGFGLPLLEAMTCGVPVIAANNSSIPEVAGDAALLVNARFPRLSLNLLLRCLKMIH